MDSISLLFFFVFFIHTTLPLIKLVQRSKLFILFVSYVEPRFFLSARVCVCFVIDRSRGGARNVGDLSNLPAGMLLVATLVCVRARSGPEMRKSVVYSFSSPPFIFIRNYFRIPFFLFFSFLCAHLFYVNCCGRAKWHSS